MDVVAALGVGKETVMADAVKAGWQDMDEEAPHKLRRLECHGLVTIVLLGAVVLPLKGNVVFIDADEARVGDGDAVGITREVGQHGLGPGEGRSCIDVPFAPAKSNDETFESARVGKRLELGKEVQALLGVEGEEFIEKQTSEQGGEDFDGDEEVVARGAPSVTVEGETTAGDDAVQMGMMSHGRAEWH